MGYMRPVSHYNPGKKSEFASGTYFLEDVAKPHLLKDTDPKSLKPMNSDILITCNKEFMEDFKQ